MATDRAEAVAALLVQAEGAHGAYEATELNGVYDKEWPTWYAGYLVQHGLGDLLGHEVTTDRVAEFLASKYAEFEETDPKPRQPWPAYIASRMVAAL